MRHIFIINPNAGQKGRKQDLKDRINAAAETTGIPVEIYETTGSGDGEAYVRVICQSQRAEETVRFYACGGDGALNEIVNGIYGFAHAEAGCIPIGTGNDYVRNYGTVEDFLNIEEQLKSKSVYSDLILYRGMVGGEKQSRLCVNMFNIGFDCNVVDQASRTKKWPLVSGPFAYLLSVAIILIKKKGADLCIEYGDGKRFDGKMLLVAVSNGRFCGGGIQCSPRALPNDGFIDINLVKNVSRRLFIRLFPKYAKGQHLEVERLKDLIIYEKCKKLTITPNQNEMRLCTDGDIASAGRVTFEIVPNAVKFAVPAKG